MDAVSKRANLQSWNILEVKVRLHIEKDGQQMTWVLVFSVLSVQAHGRHSIFDDNRCEFFLAPIVSIFPFILVPTSYFINLSIPWCTRQQQFSKYGLGTPGGPETLSGGLWDQSFLISEVICFPCMYGWAFQRLHDPWYHDSWMRNRHENPAIFYLVYQGDLGGHFLH